LRAKIGSILAKKEITDNEYIEIIKLQSLAKNFIEQTEEIIHLAGVSIESLVDKECFTKTNYTINTIIEKNLNSITVSPLEWFDTSTCAIDAIESKMTSYLTQIEKEIDKTLSALRMKKIYHITFWAFAIIISLFLSFVLFTTNKKMRDKQRLLEDYKKAIDQSTIVSKTDKHGIITYVNNAFCKISGYSEEELVGQPHNIVRHKSTPPAAFKSLWKTIKRGESWSGTLANLKKDQTTYWVNATVSPIYDDNNNLIEYIAIRHDITQIVNLHEEIKKTQYELIYRMGESVESRSKESGNHIQRVAHYSKLLARLYGMDNQEADTIFIASTMHDIGKIAIPDSILLKSTRLTDEEWKIMKTHAAIGYKILAGSNLSILSMAANIAYEHHERCDGKGYPQGLKAEEISIYARIVSIADVFDALISQRVYKKAWSLEKTIKHFNEESGGQFDHQLTQLFLQNIDAFIEIKERFED
jgi:PAS domain S-box-containing protein